MEREKNNDDGAQPRVFERRDEIMNAFFAQMGLTAESLCGQSYEQLREEMAEEMLADYEDNLIAAAALRIGADCIVTRDAKFAAHAPVKCATPAECLQFLQDGVFQ